MAHTGDLPLPQDFGKERGRDSALCTNHTQADTEKRERKWIIPADCYEKQAQPLCMQDENMFEKMYEFHLFYKPICKMQEYQKTVWALELIDNMQKGYKKKKGGRGREGTEDANGRERWEGF